MTLIDLDLSQCFFLLCDSENREHLICLEFCVLTNKYQAALNGETTEMNGLVITHVVLKRVLSLL